VLSHIQSTHTIEEVDAVGGGKISRQLRNARIRLTFYVKFGEILLFKFDISSIVIWNNQVMPVGLLKKEKSL
jgi:hypothetical protein